MNDAPPPPPSTGTSVVTGGPAPKPSEAKSLERRAFLAKGSIVAILLLNLVAIPLAVFEFLLYGVAVIAWFHRA